MPNCIFILPLRIGYYVDQVSLAFYFKGAADTSFNVIYLDNDLLWATWYTNTTNAAGKYQVKILSKGLSSSYKVFHRSWALFMWKLVGFVTWALYMFCALSTLYLWRRTSSC